MPSPEQLVLEVLRGPGVVLPAGQLWQPEVGREASPPAECDPAAHSWHPVPPNPGRHTAMQQACVQHHTVNIGNMNIGVVPMKQCCSVG